MILSITARSGLGLKLGGEPVVNARNSVKNGVQSQWSGNNISRAAVKILLIYRKRKQAALDAVRPTTPRLSRLL